VWKHFEKGAHRALANFHRDFLQKSVTFPGVLAPAQASDSPCTSSIANLASRAAVLGQESAAPKKKMDVEG